MEQQTLAWTAPGEIDGEPAEVADLVIQQLSSFAVATARLAAQSYVQLRAAGLENFDSVEEWENSPAGELAAKIQRHALGFCSSIRDLQAA